MWLSLLSEINTLMEEIDKIFKLFLHLLCTPSNSSSFIFLKQNLDQMNHNFSKHVE